MDFFYLHVDSATNKRASNGDIIYLCTCTNCGKTNIEVSRSVLTSFHKKSCGCISRSKGELLIEEILTEQGFQFETEVKIKELSNYRFDFKVYKDKDKDEYVYIEYDGEQHYLTDSYYYDIKMKEHDIKKNEYCKNKGIPLYRIPYWDFQHLSKTRNLFEEKYLIN